MIATNLSIGSIRSEHPLGVLLRAWRDKRSRSQLDLSLDVGVSQRHLSFIESGKSAPSRSLLMAILQALQVPLRDRNSVLLAAGFAPVYAEPAWDAEEMRAVNHALARMLKQHEPYPALVMDRYWNVLSTNDSAPRFFGGFIDIVTRPKPRNLLKLIFDPTGMRPFIDNWPTVAGALFERINRESVGGVIDETTRELIAELRVYADMSVSDAIEQVSRDESATTPVVPIGFVKDGRVLSYFSMISTVGTPQTIAAQELRVECMFPADDATEAWHLSMFG